MARVIRDGKAYDGAECVVTALGNVWDDVVEITYSTEREHQQNHTLGSHKASSWSWGKQTHEGSVTLMMRHVAQLERAAGGDLVRIKPFAMNVTFTDEYNVIVNDTVYCKFANQGRSVTTEMGLSQQFNLFVIDIDFNNL